MNTPAVLLDLSHTFCIDGDTDDLDRQAVESHFNKSIHQIFEFLTHLPCLETAHFKLMTGSEEFCQTSCRAFDIEFIELDANRVNLPDLPMALSLNCCVFNVAWLPPQTYCRLASKMTRLDEVWWMVQDRISRYRSVQTFKSKIDLVSPLPSITHS